MSMSRLSYGLLLLVLAGPSRAQDAGLGVMLDELAGLSDAAYAQDAKPARPRPAQRQLEQRQVILHEKLPANSEHHAPPGSQAHDTSEHPAGQAPLVTNRAVKVGR